MNRNFVLRIVRAALACLALAIAASPAAALEALDGRVQVHGFFESQMRVIGDDFRGDFDLAQWHQVLNVEFEVDILPDGWGYVDLLQAYVRIEGRYDCVYTKGCGMVQGADTYGDKAKNLPKRLASGRDSTFHGAILLDQTSRRVNEFVDSDGDGIEDTTRQTLDITRHGDRVADNRRVLSLAQTPGFSGFAELPGADGYNGKAPFGNAANGLAALPNAANDGRAWKLNGVLTPSPGLGTGDPGGDWALLDDDPFNFVFTRFTDFKFAHRGLRGGANGGLPIATMGPWLPKNFVFPNAMLADVGNPFDATVNTPLITTAAFNGSYYSNTDWGLNFSAGNIDPDEPRTFFENLLLDLTQRPNNLGGKVFSNLLKGAIMSSADTSLVPTFFGDPVGLLYLPPPQPQPTDPFPGNLFAERDAGKITGVQGSIAPNRRGTAKPLRPIPIIDAGDYAVGDTRARGVYLPSRPLRDTIASGRLDRLPFNIDERSRTWNRGASQDEGELKEAYVDIETWDSRLWLRLGKQNIVWGKTELFRTTDQFNPVDLALVTLGSLEETRIALWSARAVMSLYEIGPFDDVRIEFAANIDDFESNDLGACGEPFTPNPVCGGTFGTFAHGTFGIGLAGVDFPDAPWEDISKIEFGGRLEWRWDRFSFAIADFYGYEDLPYLQRISTFERNVDPNTGRMRAIGARGPCTTQPLGARSFGVAGIPDYDPDCLQAGPTRRDNRDAELIPGGVALNTYLAQASQFLPGSVDEDGNPNQVFGSDGMPILDQGDGVFVNGIPGDPSFSPQNALDASPVNQQFFTAICAGTVGISSLDPAACAGTIFGSQQALPIEANLFRLAPILGNVLTGSPLKDQFPGADNSVGFGTNLLAPAVGIKPAEMDLALVKLNRDPFDAEPNGRGPFGEWQWAEGSPGMPGYVPADTVIYDGPNKGCVDNSLVANSELTRVEPTSAPPNPVFTVDTPIPCHSSGSTTDNLGLYLTVEQQALLGCGPFFGTNCADAGLDLLHAEASVLFQSFPGFDGTADPAGGVNFRGDPTINTPQQWTTTNRKQDGTIFGARLADDGQDRIQPGTLFFRGGPVGTVVVDQTTGEQVVLPGARSPFTLNDDNTLSANYFDVYPAGHALAGQVIPNASCDPTDPSFVPDNPNCGSSVYNSTADGCIGDPAFYASYGLPVPPGCSHAGAPNVPLHALKHPLVTEKTLNIPSLGISGLGGSDEDQFFRSEMAALSFNFLMLLTVTDSRFNEDRPYAICEETDARDGTCKLDTNGDTIPVCSIATPQRCGNVRGLLGLAGLTRNTLRAGGDGTFGRRTFAWQSGGEGVIGFKRRNVLGFSGDFAEDFTKANFSMEATWINNVPRGYSESFTGNVNADDYNITLSIDRPTFVNFLNANRTFFFNTQWFFRYRDFSGGAPDQWDLLGTFSILAGYFQDRLLPSVTFVYDIRSSTGAVLPQIQYRYTEAFSIVVGAQFFAGRPTTNPISVNPVGPASNQQGQYAYQSANDVGVSIIRAMDNFFIRLRFAF